MEQCLLLNASCEPMKVVHWTKAVCMWLDKKVEILAEYSVRVYEAIDDWSGKMPAVVRLFKYVTAHKNKVKFSRRNVFARDRFTGQYCSDQPGTHELTYDHILPRSRGGKTCWENITTCCHSCNGKKGDNTPTEAGMKLKSKPKKPSTRPLLGNLFLSIPHTPEEWRDWLYWEQDLEE